MSGNNSVKGVFLRMWSFVHQDPKNKFRRKHGYYIMPVRDYMMSHWYQDSIREAVAYQYALRDFESSGEPHWVKPPTPADKMARDTAFKRRKQFHQRHYICMRFSRIRGGMHWILYGDGF